MNGTGARAAVIAALAWALPAMAQAVPPAAQDAQASDKEITVVGTRMPAAEAPRSSTCEQMIRDSHFAAVVASTADQQYERVDMLGQIQRMDVGGLLPPVVRLPTRMPRNPDYAKGASGAAVLAPTGRSRFRVEDENDPNAAVIGRQRANNRYSADQSAGDGAQGLGEDGSTAQSAAPQSVDEQRTLCRTRYTRGNGKPVNRTQQDDVSASLGFGGDDRYSEAMARFAAGRAEIASRDQTLPMAFALFDAGRYADSLEWFRKASGKLPFEMGGDEAALFIGKLYLQGLGDKSDPVIALKWLKKAALAPYNPTLQTPVFDPRQPERISAIGEGAIVLGNVYRTGFKGVGRNPGEARKWYARAWEVGYIPAAKVLGDLHMVGTSLPRNPKKAASYYQKAAKYGLTSAEVALADLLFTGDVGLPANRKEALTWYRKAAEADEPQALVALGRAYDLGEGVKADPQTAIGFYKTAALKGNAAAKTALGTYFHEGKLVAKDESTARDWFEQAAEEADPDGMFNLAAMMATGQGGQRDLTSAWLWLKEANARGHQQASVAMAAVERQMSPAELQLTKASAQR